VTQTRGHTEVDLPRESMSTNQRESLDDEQFAFPQDRKEPLTDAEHVRNAIARFHQVEGVSDRERDQAWNRIKKAATRFGVQVTAGSWRDLGGYR